MVNTNKLKGKIVECGMNISELAELIGIDKATLYRKELKLSKEEVNDIFFSQYVA